jgi:hypothetical protein
MPVFAVYVTGQIPLPSGERGRVRGKIAIKRKLSNFSPAAMLFSSPRQSCRAFNTVANNLKSQSTLSF